MMEGKRGKYKLKTENGEKINLQLLTDSSARSPSARSLREP
jgi:hypothetical protein